MYVSGTIYEGDNPGDNGFDSITDIADTSGQKFNTTSDEDEIKIAYNSPDDELDYKDGPSSSDDESNSDSNNVSDNDDLNDSNVRDDNDSIISDNSFSSICSNNSNITEQYDATTDFVGLDQFMTLSNEVKALSNRIDSLALTIDEQRIQMEDGFAMSALLLQCQHQHRWD